MYYCGLDLGTSSIGWALADPEYCLLRKKGKDLWGVRLFEEAKTSQERRGYRISRRRRAREAARIGLLKEYFADAIGQVDPGFYQRLEESKYHESDRRTGEKYTLFCDKSYTDQEYFKAYPTIFHLRTELLKNHTPHDVRLVYLAVLNLFKHRGHFLNENIGDETGGETMREVYLQLCDRMQEAGMEVLPLEVKEEEKAASEVLEEVLADRELNRSQKLKRISSFLHISGTKNKLEYEILKLICGLSGSLSRIWDKEILGEDYVSQKICFSEERYDTLLQSLGQLLPAEDIEVLECAKKIHDKGILEGILKGHTYLSEARVASYEKHQADLNCLKSVIKRYCKAEYGSYFRKMLDDNYSGYIGSVNSDKEKIRRNKEAGKDNYKEFWKRTEKLLNSMPEADEDVIYLKKELENERLLPKQLTSQNGVIPNQLHLMELKAILKNAEGYLPFLKEVDESGYTVTERILQLFSFRIPYYVGPLFVNREHQGNAWVVRREAGKVLPWNLEDKIDLEKTREAFIARMVRRCTYLNHEMVLPKSSLLYQRFMVLNELNNVRIYGEKLGVDAKQKIYRELFCKRSRVSMAQFVEFLKVSGIVPSCEKEAVSGIDHGFQNALTSYHRFYEILGERIHTYDMEQMAEAIIFYGTVFSDDKKMMKDWLEKNYGPSSVKPYLTKEEIRRISGYKWKDWGRLSREFLELPGYPKGSAESVSLIQAMWETDCNLMELLSSESDYMKNLEQRIGKQEKLLREFSYQDLEDSYLSAPVKRMVWQTLLILKELIQVTGEAPAKLFVEMPRGQGEKGKRTASRKKQLEELYKSCQKEEQDWLKEIDGLSEDALRSKKLYLYYRQKGRCMYTGNRISLENLLSNNSHYDIDHIYPRHYVKDDSLEHNLVLVEKASNQYKSDHFPIDENVQKHCHTMWKSLLDQEFISKEKYFRLTRKTEFTEEELAGFINRQIVETGQATKFVAHLLEELLPETEVVYVKAGNVSEFRKKMELLKARSLNDFHHANDAYLNIVVGNTYHTKFTKNPLHFIRSQQGNRTRYHMDKIFQYDVTGKEGMAWKTGEDGTIRMVKRMMGRNTPLVTRMGVEEHGGLADQTVCPARIVKENPGSYFPLKTEEQRLTNVSRYGGFQKIKGSYYFLVEHEVKKKRIRSLEQLPAYLRERADDNVLEDYCREILGYKGPEVRLSKILMQSLVKRDGFFMYLGGRTNARILGFNAVQLCLGQEWNNYVARLERFKEKGKETDTTEDLRKRITKERNAELYQELMKKHTQMIYRQKPNPLGDKLKEKQEGFQELTLKDQVSVLLEILKVSMSKNLSLDAKELELKHSVTLFGKKISDQQEFLLIHQSVTGLFETVIDLKTV